MKKEKCLRCSCVQAGRQCVDCWPSKTLPINCTNLRQDLSSTISADNTTNEERTEIDTVTHESGQESEVNSNGESSLNFENLKMMTAFGAIFSGEEVCNDPSDLWQQL